MMTSDPNRLKVLLYHRVVEDVPGGAASQRFHVGVSQFRRHLELLNTSGFTPVTFADCLLARKGDLRLPKRPVILTFAEAYRDTHRLVFPLLKEFGISGVVFATGDRNLKTDCWNNRLGLNPEPLMRGEEIVEMHRNGIEIGSNSMSHSDLTVLPEREAWREIAESKGSLESLLGDVVSTFSYPFGAVNDRVKRMVREARYAFGCGIDTGPGAFGADPYDILRISVTGSMIRLALRMLTSREFSVWTGANFAPAGREAFPGAWAP